VTRPPRPAGRFPGRRAVCLRAAGFLAAAAALLASSTCSPYGAWDLLAMRALALFPQYGRVMSLTLDNTGQTEDLVDFPLLVTLTPERFQYAAAAPGGSDLRFVSADGNTTLPHEIEQWNEGGTSLTWVSVPLIPGGATLKIELLYDGPEGGVPEAPAELWKDYELVYHLDDSPVVDSTGNNPTVIPVGSPDHVAGRIGLAFPLSDWPPQYIDTGYQPPLSLTQSWTVEAWIYPSAPPTDSAAGATGPVMGGDTFNISWDSDLVNPSRVGAVYATDASAGTVSVRLSGSWPPTPQWYYVVGVYDGSAFELRGHRGYDIDTIEALGPVDVLNPPLAQSGTNTYIGTADSTLVMDGIVDEVRISAKVRSADWIRAQYLSMTDAFITYGPTLTR